MGYADNMRKGVPAVLLVTTLVGLTGCQLLRREPEPPMPTASETVLIQADQAWLDMDYEEARRLYLLVAESHNGDPNREEALLRLAQMAVVLPGDGPDADEALQLLEAMDPEAMSPGQAAARIALLQLIDFYGGDREAIRMLLEQNRRLEAQLAGWEQEAIRQKASLYQWRKDVGRANQRVEQLEVELEKIRQEIKLLKDIDMMLQNEDGEPPTPSGTTP